MTVQTLGTRALFLLVVPALVALTACGGSSSGGTSAGAASPSSSTAPTVTIKVTVSNGKIDPAPHAVDAKKGERIAITVTSDKAEEIHVHGYDLKKDLDAGQPGELDFTADQAGRFEVELEHEGKTLFQLLVR